MPGEYCTGPIGLATVTLHRQRDIMRRPAMQMPSYVMVRPLRGTGVPTRGHVVTDWNGVEFGVSVRSEAARLPASAVVQA